MSAFIACPAAFEFTLKILCAMHERQNDNLFSAYKIKNTVRK